MMTLVASQGLRGATSKSIPACRAHQRAMAEGLKCWEDFWCTRGGRKQAHRDAGVRVLPRTPGWDNVFLNRTVEFPIVPGAGDQATTASFAFPVKPAHDDRFMSAETATTPMMKQYLAMRRDLPADVLLLFRLRGFL
jgi:hypothetical protein